MAMASIANCNKLPEGIARFGEVRWMPMGAAGWKMGDFRRKKWRAEPFSSLNFWSFMGKKTFVQWIGLREHLQEHPIFNGKIDGFRLRFSLKPIHWFVSFHFRGKKWAWIFDKASLPTEVRDSLNNGWNSPLWKNLFHPLVKTWIFLWCLDSKLVIVFLVIRSIPSIPS